MNTVQEPRTTSRMQHQVSSQLVMGHQDWQRAPHLGTGWRKLRLKHTLPSGPCYNKASDQGFRGVQNQRRLNFTEDWANSPLSILLCRSMIPGKAAARKEIKHWRYAFLWAMEHCQMCIQKEEFLTPFPGIQREPRAHVAPECSHVKITCTLAKPAMPQTSWALPSLLGIVQCSWSPFPGCQGRAGACSWPSLRGTHRSLLVSFPDAECVLKHCVHDPANAKRGLNDIWDDFFHWNTKYHTSPLKMCPDKKKMLAFCSHVDEYTE